jgi:hypothetical protein
MIDTVPRGRAIVALSMALLLIVPVTAGCLSEDEPMDLSEWWVALTVDKFDPNGERAVNVTELLFKVRFGDLNQDTWMLQESHGFFKGDEDYFPIRLEARYDDKVNPVEDFPILGDSHIVTAALRFDGDRMGVQVDGDKDLIVKDRSIDNLPHDYERTVRLTGDYGELTLYFNLNEPA